MEIQNQVIKLQNINYTIKNNHDRVSILKNINFEIGKGATVAITGASGSGKTSLLNLMAGLALPDSGQIFYDNQNICLLDEDKRAQWRSGRVGFIFQSFQLLPNLTALENTALPLEIIQHPCAADTAQIWLERVGLQHRAHHYPLKMSGGEQQRVAIARAFAVSPLILFADEPTGNLDKHTGKMIADLLFELNKARQTTLVLVTHDESLAARCQLHWPLNEGTLQC